MWYIIIDNMWVCGASCGWVVGVGGLWVLWGGGVLWVVVLWCWYYGGWYNRGGI